MWRRAVGSVTELQTATPVRPRSTEGRLVYAVGDVHGNLDLLQALLAEIARDALASQPTWRPLLIFVGDYIDRGPASAGVLDAILSLKRSSAFEVRALKGNHEEAMLKFLEDSSFGPTWVRFGGADTLASYGVAPPGLDLDGSGWAATQAALDEALSPAHREFLETLELMVRVGDYAFVHAGVDPEESLERQVEHDVLWIRGEFLTSKLPRDGVVVHGHTPSDQPQVLANRIGIDTGAYATGLLTALRLLDGDQSLILAQAEGGPSARR
jgi:serine/threonine protein phosphatase 1